MTDFSQVPPVAAYKRADEILYDIDHALAALRMVAERMDTDRIEVASIIYLTSQIDGHADDVQNLIERFKPAEG